MAILNCNGVMRGSIAIRKSNSKAGRKKRHFVLCKTNIEGQQMTDKEQTLDELVKKVKSGEFVLDESTMVKEYSSSSLKDGVYREYFIVVRRNAKSLLSVKQRLEDEFNELNERIDKLSAFMDSKDFTDLPFREMQLMNIQRDSMNAYRTTLNARIAEIERRIN